MSYTIWYEKYDYTTRKFIDYFIPFSGNYQQAKEMLQVVIQDTDVQRAIISPDQPERLRSNES